MGNSDKYIIYSVQYLLDEAVLNNAGEDGIVDPIPPADMYPVLVTGVAGGSEQVLNTNQFNIKTSDVSPEN